MYYSTISIKMST